MAAEDRQRRVGVCSAISEPAHGSNVAGIETYAERDSDGCVLNGTKMWITNGTIADVAVVMAKTTPTPATRDQRVPRADGYRRPADRENRHKSSIRASDLAEVVIDDVRVPAENLIGDGRWLLPTDGLLRERAGKRSRASRRHRSGRHRRPIEYANELEQFGQPISEFRPSNTRVRRWPPTSRLRGRLPIVPPAPSIRATSM